MKGYLVLITLLLMVRPAFGNNIERCGLNESLIINGYMVVSNGWNPIDKNMMLCISEGGWRWKIRGGRYTPQAYPSFIFGHKPWHKASTTERLPTKVNQVDLNVHIDIETKSKGKSNSAVDLWLTSDNNPSPNNITTEIMVWLNKKNMQPAGRVVSEIEINGKLYDIWQTKMHSWNYIALMPRKQSEQLNLNMRILLEKLSDMGLVDRSDYLASIEFGNEIINGNGHSKVTFKVYSTPRCIDGCDVR